MGFFDRRRRKFPETERLASMEVDSAIEFGGGGVILDGLDKMVTLARVYDSRLRSPSNSGTLGGASLSSNVRRID